MDPQEKKIRPKKHRRDKTIVKAASEDSPVPPNKSRNNRSKKKPADVNNIQLRTDEINQLEHKLMKTSQFKLINTNSKAKTYKIHITKNDQFRLIIPFDKSQLMKLKSNDLAIQDVNELDKSTKNVIDNFNNKVKTTKSNPNIYNCLFFVNYLVNNVEVLKLDNRAFKEYETSKIMKLTS